MSPHKAQICKQEVAYLGFQLKQGTRSLMADRKQAIAPLKIPENRRQLRGFLGITGFCRIWIPNFGLIAKPLYNSLKGLGSEPLEWTRDCQVAFDTLKEKLASAPALGLPDLQKPFKLYIHERQGIGLGVLTQTLGNIPRPIAYLSKKLDHTTKGWPSCLRAVAATCDILQEAEKFTLGQPTTLLVPHQVLTLLEQRGGYWLTAGRMGKYQAILLDNPNVTLQTTTTLNPATLLPDVEGDSTLEHECVEIIDQVYSSRPDLMDQPLASLDWELYTDGSSFMDNGQRRAGYAVATADKVIEAQGLTPGTSAQKAELIALTRALLLSQGKKVNIYTDSKYAFMVVHAHGAIWRERGLLTSGNKDVKHAEVILQLLEAVNVPDRVAIMHCPGHQRDGSQTSQGNQVADRAARQAAKKQPCLAALVPHLDLSEFKPHYTEQDEERAREWGFTNIDPNSMWRVNAHGMILLPEALVYPVLKHLYEGTHYGRDALMDFIRPHLKGPYLQKTVHRISQACQICAKNNPKTEHAPTEKGVQYKGMCPFEDWQVDFTQMPKTTGNFRFLLVFVDTFSGWVEAYPTRTEKATEVAKLLLKEIIPRFGLPQSIQSDNGPSFTSEISQKVGQALQIQWKLHASWRPQSTGKTEKMNHTIKKTLAKICQETHLKWDQALPIALLRIRVAPRSGLKLSPFEIVYGKPLRISVLGTPPLDLEHEARIKQYVQHLGQTLTILHKFAHCRSVYPSDEPLHPFQPGDQVLLKTWKAQGPEQQLSEQWTGPYDVLLTTHSSLKLMGIKPWIHHTRVKRAPPKGDVDPPAAAEAERESWTCTPEEGLKFLFRKKTVNPDTG